MTWTVDNLLSAAALVLTVALYADKIIGRLMGGKYATHAWVEGKLKPVTDAEALLRGRIHDVETEHKLLKQGMGHLPTVGHLDQIKEDLAQQGLALARIDERGDGNSRELTRVHEALDRIWEELKEQRKGAKT